MVMSEIQEKIDYYNAIITDCSCQAEALERKLQETSAMRSELNTFMEKISEESELRKSRLNTIGQEGVSSKILGRYYDGMNDMLTGAKFQENFYNLELGLHKIDCSIEDLSDQLVRLNAQRDDALGSKAYWESQMQYAEDFSA